MPNASIDSLSFDTSNWKQYSKEGEAIIWVNDYGEAAMLQFYSSKPDFRTPLKEEFIDEIRKDYRTFTQENNAGIIGVELFSICGIPSIEVVVKKQLEHKGYGYNGSVILALKDFWYLILFEAEERGLTGLRESTISILESKKREKEDQEKKSVGSILQPRDPYDPVFDEGALFKLTDNEEYDHLLPKHPLSRIRHHLRILRKTINVDDYIRNYPPHIGN